MICSARRSCRRLSECAGDEPVGVAELDHNDAEVHRVADELCGFFLGQPFALRTQRRFAYSRGFLGIPGSTI